MDRWRTWIVALPVSLAAPGIVTTGCCADARQIVEVEFSSPFYDSQQRQLEGLQDNGWTCITEGAIRNGFGQTIGYRYACTKC